MEWLQNRSNPCFGWNPPVNPWWRNFLHTEGVAASNPAARTIFCWGLAAFADLRKWRSYQRSYRTFRAPESAVQVMANNRMFLLHRPSGKAVYLGKRMGWGWYAVRWKTTKASARLKCRTTKAEKTNDRKRTQRTQRNKMKLSTGRDIDAYAGVIGIDSSGQVYGGHDQIFEGAFAACPDRLDAAEWGVVDISRKERTG